MEKIPVIVICGPTASGKTALSVELAKAMDGEIISADSMQIYKYMDIGSAKPDEAEREGIPHHLMDIIEPCENFSVAEYQQMAHRAIYDVTSRGKLPIMVGGTGLYINSVINDVDFADDGGDEALRAELLDFAKANGALALHEKLRELDAAAAEKIHMNNVRRVIRAIEFIKLNGKSFSEHNDKGKKKDSRYRPLMFDIGWDRDVLYERINKRVDIMFDAGLEAEVKRLLEMGVPENSTAMQGIGYKETAEYLNGLITLDEAKDKIKQASRRYAKRQLTWFRRDNRIIHLSPSDAISEGIELTKKFLRGE